MTSKISSDYCSLFSAFVDTTLLIFFVASERQDRERLRQETEIDELRAALKRSAGVVQLDETRRELEKSERQRQQLSDHIEVRLLFIVCAENVESLI